MTTPSVPADVFPSCLSLSLCGLSRMGDIAEDEASFYSNAEDYWREVPPTVDGMLGGYGSISNIDINGSKAFLKKFLGVRPKRPTASSGPSF